MSGARLLAWIEAALLAVCLLCWPYIALEAAIPIRIGPLAWDLDAPLADLGALGLLAIAAARQGSRGRAGIAAARAALSDRWLRLAILGYALFLLAGLAGAAASLRPGESLRVWLRKEAFMGLAWGVGLAHAAARADPARLRRWAAAGVGLAAAISAATSVVRIGAGGGLWFAPIGGLTNNHKTIAVAIAPLIVLGWGWGGAGRRAGALGLVAAALSAAKTAWIGLATGAAAAAPIPGRWRAGLAGLAAAGGIALSLYLPLITGSLEQLDAARSRHSLNRRALEMFWHGPLLGQGSGSNLWWEVSVFPHYRVNGVDAHGAIQKIASEHGLIGLAAWGLWLYGIGRWLATPGRAWVWPAFAALNVQLLLSTETFSQTYWLPLALMIGLSWRAPGRAEPWQGGSG